MKSVLISIQPKWCELIASDKKTIEVRKTRPKVDTPFKVYIYETNWKDNTYWKNYHKDKLGKVIGEFVCSEVFKIDKDSIDFIYRLADYSMYFGFGKLAYNLDTCLTDRELLDYLNHRQGYGWHISDLVIYDEPKELSEFKHWKKFDWWDYGHHTNKPQWELRSIERPPQSWCYVEKVGEG